jgi:Cu-Zn family superoxide dismutase
MTLRLIFAALAMPVALAACSTVADLPERRVGQATVLLPNGQPAGTAQLVEVGNRVTLAVGVAGLAPGVHGIHLHTTGSCKAPDFASASGHLNPLGRQHGSMSANGKHAGDLPNITVAAGGTGTMTADLSGTPDEVRGWLFDADGTAIVVHADADDYKTDPSGNSGARIACGVLSPG